MENNYEVFLPEGANLAKEENQQYSLVEEVNALLNKTVKALLPPKTWGFRSAMSALLLIRIGVVLKSTSEEFMASMRKPGYRPMAEALANGIFMLMALFPSINISELAVSRSLPLGNRITIIKRGLALSIRVEKMSHGYELLIHLETSEGVALSSVKAGHYDHEFAWYKHIHFNY